MEGGGKVLVGMVNERVASSSDNVSRCLSPDIILEEQTAIVEANIRQ